MKIQTLHALRTVRRLGSLRAAARELNVTQPALTVAIRQLEDELGVRLLERNNTGVRPTIFGTRLIEHAERILGEVERARQHIAHMRGEWTGTVRFSASPASSVSIVPLALRSFARKHPGVRIECSDGVYPSVAARIRSDSLDFALTPVSDRHLDSDLISEPLFTGQVVIACRIDHPLRSARTLDALQAVSWVDATPSPGPGAVMEKAFGQAGLRAPEVAMICESLLTLLGVIAGTDHMAALPETFFQQIRGAWPIQALDMTDPLPVLEVRVLRRKDAPMTPVAQGLLGWIRYHAERASGTAAQNRPMEPGATETRPAD